MDLRCLGLPLEILAVLRNFSAESCGHVGGGQGGAAIYPRMFASLGCWEKQPAQFWVMGSSFSTTGGACVCQLPSRAWFRC